MDGYIGEIRAVGFTFSTPQWMICSGQILEISQYQLLYAVIGNTYGGNSKNGSFALPNLQGYAVTGVGTPSSKVVQVAQGQVTGELSVTLNLNQMPVHKHLLYPGQAESGGNNFTNYSGTPTTGSMLYRLIADVTETSTTGSACLDYTPYTDQALKPLAAQSISSTGTTAPAAHENCQPYQVLNFMICIEGEFPTPD